MSREEHEPPDDAAWAFTTPGQAARHVLDYLGSLRGGGVVALSGGADSALLLDLAATAWGREACVAVTSRSASLPVAELEDAKRQAVAAGVRHVCLDGGELDLQAFRENTPDRCFHCKNALYGAMRGVARRFELAHVLDGTNADDVGDHRPGLAAARRHGVVSPLLETGITKAWVRAISRARGLPTWDKPSEACLSSRVPYGTEVTREALARVERAERALKDLGFRTVRVRDHHPVARIEVPPEALADLVARGMRERVLVSLQSAGFLYVTLDLQGFRSGSLNEVLRRDDG